MAPSDWIALPSDESLNMSSIFIVANAQIYGQNR
jgi:hypothetical protein